MTKQQHNTACALPGDLPCCLAGELTVVADSSSDATRASCKRQRNYKGQPDKRQSVKRELSAGKSAPILDQLQPDLPK